MSEEYFAIVVSDLHLVSYNNKKSGEPPDKVKGGFKQ